MTQQQKQVATSLGTALHHMHHAMWSARKGRSVQARLKKAIKLVYQVDEALAKKFYRKTA